MNVEKTDGAERTDDLRAFLLGSLAERDAERVEYSLLSDDRSYELLLATEEELIDEYLRGTLSPSEASSFLGYLDRLPGGRTRIDFARELRARLGASRTRPFRRFWEEVSRGFSALVRGPNPAWAGALVLAFLGLAIYASIGPRESPPLVLTAGLTRGEGDVAIASLAASGQRLRVMLELGAHLHGRYRATLYDADSREILSSEGLTANATERRILVAFHIPTEGIEPGDYFISLLGETPSKAYEPLGQYRFRLME